MASSPVAATADVQTALTNLQVAAIKDTPVKIGDLLQLQTGIGIKQCCVIPSFDIQIDGQLIQVLQ